MYFEKVPCMAIYIVKIEVQNDSRTMWDSFQTSVFNAKNLSFIVSETLHACTGLCLHAHASWLQVQVDSYARKPRVSLALHFNISQVNLTFDWALNQP